MILHELTIGELTKKLASKEVSSREAMQACLDRIDEVDEKMIVERIRKYYEEWMHRLSVHDGIETMTQVSTAFKLHYGKLRCQDITLNKNK